MVTIYTDGGCEGNGQRDLAQRHMRSVARLDTGEIIADEHTDGGSNNIAELRAVCLALRWAREQGLREIQIRTDSQVILVWLRGKRLGTHLNDRTMVETLRAEVAGLSVDMRLILAWIPREDNIAGHYIESRYS